MSFKNTENSDTNNKPTFSHSNPYIAMKLALLYPFAD